MPFKTFVPKSSLGNRKLTFTTSCKGCGRKFLCTERKDRIQPEFYHHCVEDCVEYKKLSKCSAQLASNLIAFYRSDQDL